MSAIRLSLIICTYNRARFVRRLLLTLLAQAQTPEVEIVVVDNNSTDDTRSVIGALASGRPFVRMVFEEKQGLSHARNCGAAAARGSHLLYLDDDALAPEGFVEAIRKVVARDPDFFGGPVYPIYADPRPREFPEALEIRKKAALSGFRYDLTLSGGNFGVRKETLERFGGFDPHYGMAGGRMGLLEERLLIDAYRERTPAAEQRLYYAVEAYVFHHTPRERMDFRYQRRRIALGDYEMTRHELSRRVRNEAAFRRAAFALHFGSLVRLARTLISPRTNGAARFAARIETARTAAVVRAAIEHALLRPFGGKPAGTRNQNCSAQPPPARRFAASHLPRFAGEERAAPPACGGGVARQRDGGGMTHSTAKAETRPLRLLWLKSKGGGVDDRLRQSSAQCLAELPVVVDAIDYDSGFANPQLQAQAPAALKSYDAVLFEDAIPRRAAILTRAHYPHLQFLLLWTCRLYTDKFADVVIASSSEASSRAMRSRGRRTFFSVPNEGDRAAETWAEVIEDCRRWMRRDANSAGRH